MRDDLLALSADRLVLLANAGLVKRAQKELGGGVAPKIEEEPDGTVLGSFNDGAKTRLPRETPLRSSPCSCGAAGVCRHRVALVLAYQLLHASAEQPSSPEDWDPGRIEDDTLLAACGGATVELARSALQGSFLVTTRPGAIPVAQLPSATVQFLAPNDLAAARCDCARRHGCEHVVLAVWAFRRQPTGGLLELGVAGLAVDPEARSAVEHALERIADHGLTDVGTLGALASARATAEKQAWLWVADALEELERQRDAWDRQSASFSTRRCAEVLVEVRCRLAATEGAGPLPARFVLGSEGPQESQLEQVRLISLGARLEADDERRSARVYFADPDGGGVLVLEKEWAFPKDAPPRNGPDLGELFASSRMTLSSLARSELVTRSARRRANGRVDLSVARGMKSSVLSASDAWSALTAPVAIADLAAYAAEVRKRPPAFLRPRHLGEDVHLIAIGGVVDVSWIPGEQELTAVVSDAAGERLLLRLAHRTVAPGAVDALARAVEEKPRFVSGRLRRSRDGWELTPLAILGQRLVIPDLERPSPSGRPLVPGESARASPSELDTLLEELAALTELGIHKGVAAARTSAETLARRLDEAGMGRVAEKVSGVAKGDRAALLDVAVIAAVARGTESSP